MEKRGTSAFGVDRAIYGALSDSEKRAFLVFYKDLRGRFLSDLRKKILIVNTSAVSFKNGFKIDAANSSLTHNVVVLLNKAYEIFTAKLQDEISARQEKSLNPDFDGKRLIDRSLYDLLTSDEKRVFLKEIKSIMRGVRKGKQELVKHYSNKGFVDDGWNLSRPSSLLLVDSTVRRWLNLEISQYIADQKKANGELN